MSEDITFCMNHNCNIMKCERNPKHIKLPISHSYAYLEDTEDCMRKSKKVQKEVGDRQ